MDSCPSCQYDLAGISNAALCPECGADLDGDVLALARASQIENARWSRVLFLLSPLIGLGAGVLVRLLLGAPVIPLAILASITACALITMSAHRYPNDGPILTVVLSLCLAVMYIVTLAVLVIVVMITSRALLFS
jgi:hypothetical protein